MPRLWNDTIEAHRNAVHNAILDTTAALVMKHGLTSVTMSQIAEQTGVGRATLYKYFPDVETILQTWHARQVHHHLEKLGRVTSESAAPLARLEAVLEAYALIAHEHHGHELAGLLHRGEHFERAEKHLREFLKRLVKDATVAGDVREDTSPDELVSYCLHALAAASTLRSKPAVRRLVKLTLAGLRPDE